MNEPAITTEQNSYIHRGLPIFNIDSSEYTSLRTYDQTRFCQPMSFVDAVKANAIANQKKYKKLIKQMCTPKEKSALNIKPIKPKSYVAGW